MKKILVPTDFSECADNAMSYALELAKNNNASIHILHTILPTEGIDNNIYNTLWINDYIEAKKTAMSKWVEKYKDEKSPISYDCLVGFAVTTICDVAVEQGADLIVMGTTGASGLVGNILGSNASGVISNTDVPTLLVPKSGKFSFQENMAMSTDFKFNISDSGKALLKYIIELHESKKLNIIHVISKDSSKIETDKEEDLKAKLTGIDVDFHYAHDKQITQAISNYLELNKIGLLCVISHKHTLLYSLFFENHTKLLVKDALVPILVLRG